MMSEQRSREQRIEQLKQMVEQGKLGPEIAAATGLTLNTVRAYVYRYLDRETLTEEFRASLPQPKHQMQPPPQRDRFVVKLEQRVAQRLHETAGQRYLDTRILLESLITIIADDDLFAAILDR